MASNHLVLWILWWSVRTRSSLKRVMSWPVAMRDCHVHSVLDVLFSLLRKLRLITHVLAICLIKSTSHTHYLCLVTILITICSFMNTISIEIIRRCTISHCSWRHFSCNFPTSSALTCSFVIRASVILRAISNSWVLWLYSFISFTVPPWMRNCLKLGSIMNCWYFNWRSYCHSSHFSMSWLVLTPTRTTWIFTIAITMTHSRSCTSVWLFIVWSKMILNLLLWILFTCASFLWSCLLYCGVYSIYPLSCWMNRNSSFLLNFRIVLVFWAKFINFGLKLKFVFLLGWYFILPNIFRSCLPILLFSILKVKSSHRSSLLNRCNRTISSLTCSNSSTLSPFVYLLCLISKSILILSGLMICNFLLLHSCWLLTTIQTSYHICSCITVTIKEIFILSKCFFGQKMICSSNLIMSISLYAFDWVIWIIIKFI